MYRLPVLIGVRFDVWDGAGVGSHDVSNNVGCLIIEVTGPLNAGLWACGGRDQRRGIPYRTVVHLIWFSVHIDRHHPLQASRLDISDPNCRSMLSREQALHWLARP